MPPSWHWFIWQAPSPKSAQSSSTVNSRPPILSRWEAGISHTKSIWACCLKDKAANDCLPIYHTWHNEKHYLNWLPYSLVNWLPYSFVIMIGIIVYTPYYIFCNFTVTTVTFEISPLIFNILRGDRRGDRRVTEVTAEVSVSTKAYCTVQINCLPLPRF